MGPPLSASLKYIAIGWIPIRGLLVIPTAAKKPYRIELGVTLKQGIGDKFHGEREQLTQIPVPHYNVSTFFSFVAKSYRNSQEQVSANILTV